MANDSQGTPGEGNPSLADSTRDTPRDLLRKLRDMPLFASLTDEQFRTVSDLLRTEQVERTTLLIQQGENNTNLYMLRRGQAVVRMVDVDERDRRLQDLTVGSIFNETAFLTGLRNARTVEALTSLSLWYIPRDQFIALLAERPDIRQSLNPPADLPVRLTAKLARRRQHHTFEWQRTNEHVAHFCHKHPWVFWRSLWPLLIVVAIMVGLVVIGRNYVEPASATQESAATAPAISATLPANGVTPSPVPQEAAAEASAVVNPVIWMIEGLLILLTLGSFAFIIYQYIDWDNDYYAVTDQRLIHRERTLLIHDQQSEVPMNKVQDVSVDRPGIMSWILDYGNITIDASGLRSKVKFPDIAKPDQVSDIILSQSHRMHGDSHAVQRIKMRNELIDELHMVPSKDAGKQSGHKRQPQKFTLRRRNPLGNVRNAIMPHMRVVQGEVILYHKHWLQLVDEMVAPTIAVLVYVALLILVRLFVPGVAEIILGTPLEVGVIILGIGLLLWGLYRYENWRNDIYILTPDRIVDIDRSPFGIGPSSRREARLSAVQNVNLDMSGLWDNAFNIGDVIIQTAGAEGTLTFERVYDPHGVQRDIVDRMEAQDTHAREQQMAERRHEFAEWVGIYDELKRMYGDNSRQP